MIPAEYSKEAKKNTGNTKYVGKYKKQPFPLNFIKRNYLKAKQYYTIGFIMHIEVKYTT